MVILSAGMQKSGSAYFYNIINELAIESGHNDARQIKLKRDLNDLMRWHNNNIGNLSLNKLMMLWLISIQEGTFVVKTHSGPNLATRILSKLRLIKIVYYYRDPRDSLLSAIDHGKKIQANGNDHTFVKLVDFDKCLQHVKAWLGVWKKYADTPGVLMVKYEEMMEKLIETVKTIEEFLGISVNAKKRQEIIWKFSKDNPYSNRTGMHFNKAKIYTYKTEMPQKQKTKCQAAFGKYLEAMSYNID